MQQKNRIKLIVSVLAIIICFALLVKPLALSVKQGLDLQGGTHVVLQAEDTPEAKVDDDAMNRSISIIERRVNELGLTEPVIQRQAALVMGPADADHGKPNPARLDGGPVNLTLIV